MRFLGRSLIGIFLMALTAALLFQAGAVMMRAVEARMNAEPRSFPQRERSVAVNVVTFETETIAPDLLTFGEVQSRRTLDIRAAVGGIVEEVAPAFADGGGVAAGDLLFRVDPTEAERAVARAEADLADARAEARDAVRSLDLARDALAAAEAQEDLRDRALARQQDLQTRGVGTAPELESAELAASAAAQAVVSQRNAIGSAEARIDSSATAIERAQLALQDAERTLAETEVRAPFAGVLSDVSALEGTRVTANEQVARLIDPEALEVAFRVSTSQYAALTAGGGLPRAPVTVALDVSGVDITATGTIDRESAGLSEGQTGRLIYARLDSARGFRPGDFVTVTVAEPEQQDVARLPATALGADGAILVVGPENRLRAAEVELVRRQGDDILVRADLDGAAVVTQRTPILGPGLLVTPIGGEDGQETAEAVQELIELDEERRARILAFIEGNDRMPQEAKTRLIAQIQAERVPADVVARIESRMGS